MHVKSTRKPFYSQEYESWSVPLTQGVIALIDEDMVPILSQNNWCSGKRPRQWVALRIGPKFDGKYPKILMHRVIMGAPDRMDVDHRDHRPIELKLIDNRRANLRVCTRSENAKNQRPNRGGTSKYKGVCWNKQRGKWHAQIKTDDNRGFLGLFTDEQAAARAYDFAAEKSHGEFALTNKMLGLL